MKTLFPALVASLLIAQTACGSDDGVCGQIYDKTKACWAEKAKDDKDKDDIPSKGEFVAVCKAATKSRKEEMATMATCIKEDSCEAIDACMEKAHAAQYAKKKLEELQGQIAKQDWAAAFDSCRYSTESIGASPDVAKACDQVFTDGIPKLTGDKAKDVSSACRYSDDLKKASPSFAKACAAIAGTEYEAKKKAAIAARDQSSEDYSICFDLQQAAESVSDQAKKDAEALCAELTAAPNAKKAIDESKANIAAGKAELSYYCTMSADELGKIQPATDWSKSTLDAVLRACFVDAGKAILAVQLPQLSYCTYDLTQLRDAVKTYNLAGKDPDLDAQLAKTDKVCATSP